MSSTFITSRPRGRRGRITLGFMLSMLCACSGAASVGLDTTQANGAASSASQGAPQEASNLHKEKSPETIAGRLDASHEMALRTGDVTLKVSASACSEFTDTLTKCSKNVAIAVEDKARGIHQVLHPAQLWVDNKQTLYRGRLSDSGSPFAGDFSLILGDANGDGSTDLVVFSGKEGSYGGPSFDIYLYDEATHTLVHNQALTDLTVGHNSLFTVDHQAIRTSMTSGCCEHIHETYRFVDGVLKLIDRSSETNQKGQ